MAIRHYFILAVERLYNPEAGKITTYRVESDTSQGHYSQRRPTLGNEPLIVELAVHLTYVESSWGPNTLRIEGYIRNPRTQRANRVTGHHRDANDTATTTEEERIGLLQVIEDD